MLSDGSNLKLITCSLSFLFIFLLSWPTETGCYEASCVETALLLSVAFSWSKANEIDFFRGDVFHGWYIFGGYIKSLKEDNSRQNILKRRFWFVSLLLLDLAVIIFVIKFSWLFN